MADLIEALYAAAENEPTASRRLDVDHNHSTGKVRGLLCINCNLALGHLDDNAELAVQTALYLLRSSAVRSDSLTTPLGWRSFKEGEGN